MKEDAKTTVTKLLRAADIPLDDSQPYGITIHNEQVFSRVLAQHNLGLGESYMDGWWDCDRIDELFARVLTADLEGMMRPSPKLVMLAIKSMLSNRQTKSKAKNNAQYHYDIGNDLYEAMLDKRMVYSCGYWKDANSLDQAQEAKLDLICRKLNLEPGMRLLDIGCGWGAMANYAAANYGVSVTGITPALEQASKARERCAGQDVEIKIADYRSLTGEYDRIVSVGMMEHVGSRNLKVFFKVCDQVLARDGMMLHHTIGSNASTSHGDAFMDRYIFPGGITPSLTQISKASQKRFVIEDVQNFGPDYDRTLLAWHDNVAKAWDSLPEYDERFRRMWRYYLLSCAGAFRARSLSLWQFVMRREGLGARYDAAR